MTLLAATQAPLAAQAQGEDIACERGAPELRRLLVTGADDPSEAEVTKALATTPSSWFRRVASIPIGARHCLDSIEIARDRLRLRALHAQHGLFEARTAVEVRPAGSRTVDVIFHVTQGARTLLDSVRFAGLDAVPAARRLAQQLFAALANEDFNEPAILVAVDSVQSHLRELGHVRALLPATRLVRDTARGRAWVDVVYAPGRRVVVGAVDLAIRTGSASGEPRVLPSAVRRRLSVAVGDAPRPSLLLQSQRELFELDAYQLVRLDTAPMGRGLQLDTMRVTVNLVESTTRSLKLGAGWATLDCIRTQGRWVDRSVLGTARRLEIDVRLSKLGRGDPASFAPGLCADVVREDPFSDRLNYFAGATTYLTDLFGRQVTPQVTVYSESRSEAFAYRRDTPIGARLSIAVPLRPTVTGTAALQYEYGRTHSAEAVACLIFNACTSDELERQQLGGSLATFSLGALWDITASRIDPLFGARVRLENRLGAVNLAGGSGMFDRITGDVTLFRPIGSNVTLAARLQLGVISKLVSSGGTTANAIPLQERFFLGGQSTVRGFGQNQLGDVVYVLTAATDTVQRSAAGDTLVLNGRPADAIRRLSPVGGNALLVSNVELRVRARALGPFQFALFVDAGQVRRDAEELFRLSDVRVTPGFGARLATPFGLFRLDVGYNPYGAPGGPAYLATTGAGGASAGKLLCVSPGTTDQLVVASGAVVRTGACPSSFTPLGSSNPLSRLVFHFGIGQAF